MLSPEFLSPLSEKLMNNAFMSHCDHRGSKASHVQVHLSMKHFRHGRSCILAKSELSGGFERSIGRACGKRYRNGMQGMLR